MAGASVGAGAAAQAALGVGGSPRTTAREWAAVLEQVPLFESLSRRHLRRVTSLARARRFQGGVPIVVAGRPGDAFYVILDGRASVGVPGRRARRLGPGDYFGEMALLDDAPRSATVTADDELLVLEIGRAGFGRLLKQEPQIGLALLRVLAARVRSLERE